MRSIIMFLIFVLMGMQYKLWLGDSSILQWKRMEAKLEAQERENEKLIARNRIVEADILELKSGEQALEEQARYELGMIKKGERYYQIVN